MLDKRYLIYKLDKSLVEEKDSYLIDISYNDSIDLHFYYFVLKGENGLNVSKVYSPDTFIRKIQEAAIDFNVCDENVSYELIRTLNSSIVGKKISSEVTLKDYGLSKLDSNAIRNLLSLLLKSSPNRKMYK